MKPCSPHSRSNSKTRAVITIQSEQQLTALKNANLIKQVRQTLESDGYDTTSIATATAYAITISYGIANNLDLSQLKAHGLVHQLQEVMEEDSTMQSLSNTDKQKMADTLYWIGSLEMATARRLASLPTMPARYSPCWAYPATRLPKAATAWKSADGLNRLPRTTGPNPPSCVTTINANTRQAG